MDPVEQLRQGMVAAVEEHRRRGHARIELVPEDRPEGLSAQELGIFEATINHTAAQMRAIAASTGVPLSTVVLATAAAIGAVIARDCNPTEAQAFLDLTSQRLAASFNQMRQ